MRRKLADLSFVIIGVEVEEAPLRHDVNTGLTRVSLGLMVHAAPESVHLLRLQVDVQADKVGVARRILQIRLAHVQQSVDLFDELGAHFP